jgi:hypothetical protein
MWKKNIRPKHRQRKEEGPRGSRSGLIQATTRSGVESEGDDSVEAEKHGALEVIGSSVSDDVCHDENRYGKGNRLD